jgi:cation transport ATPase
MITPVVQGVYYLITGIWPLLSMQSFEKISGPKTDVWLVKTLALLIVAVGCTLLLHQENDKFLGIAAAFTLCLSATYYCLRQVIWKI